MSKLCNIHCNDHVSNEFPFTDNKFDSIKFNSLLRHANLPLPHPKWSFVLTIRVKRQDEVKSECNIVN